MPEDDDTDWGEVIEGEFSVEEPSRLFWKKSWIKFTGIGVLAFLLGLIIFLPLDRLFQYKLQTLQRSGILLSIEKTDLSIFGNLVLQNIRYKQSVNTRQNTAQVGIAYLQGNIALFNLLLSQKVVLKLKANGVDLVFGKDINLRGGEWSADVDLTGIDQKVVDIGGKVSIAIKNGFGKYIDDEFKIQNGVFTGKFVKGSMQISKAEFNTNIGLCQILGNVSFIGSGNLNLQIIFTPSELFNTEYKDLKDTLMYTGLLSGDGKVQLNVSGPIANPRMVPVQQKSNPNAAQQKMNSKAKQNLKPKENFGIR